MPALIRTQPPPMSDPYANAKEAVEKMWREQFTQLQGDLKSLSLKKEEFFRVLIMHAGFSVITNESNNHGAFDGRAAAREVSNFINGLWECYSEATEKKAEGRRHIE